MQQIDFYPELGAYMSGLEAEFHLIPTGRKEQLRELAAYLAIKFASGAQAQVTVICTHNSRRSHMGQLWLLAAAKYYRTGPVETYSGGTEATAFHPNAVEALRGAGFVLEKTDGTTNPKYRASMGKDLPAGELFSKKFSHPENPQRGFAALLVCSEADEACPLVPGAEARFAIPYDDPKAADGTTGEKEAYKDRCRQIAREMFFVMKTVAGK